jgi:hypothetical protein
MFRVLVAAIEFDAEVSLLLGEIIGACFKVFVAGGGFLGNAWR